MTRPRKSDCATIHTTAARRRDLFLRVHLQGWRLASVDTHRHPRCPLYTRRMSRKPRDPHSSPSPDLPDDDEAVELVLRHATEEDVEGIAQVYLDACNAAPPGALPPAFLHNATLTQQTRAWRESLALREVVVVAVLEEEVLAFAAGGRAEDADPFFRGVVDGLFVSPDIQRQRLGTQLFIEMLHRLRELAPILAWVPEQHQGARRFLEGLGGLPVRRRVETAAQRSPAIGYGFFDVG